MATYIIPGYYYDQGRFEVAFEDDYIDTTLTDSGNVVDWWVTETYRAHRRDGGHLAGLDVEWRPGRVPGPVAVLQICVDHRCLIFQILHADFIPASLSRFLADRQFTFVGVGIREDIAKLQAGYGLRVANADDLRGIASRTLGNPELLRKGLKALVLEVMGVEMDKPFDVSVSAWDAPVLSEDQRMYACVDAFVSYEVARRLYDGDY